MAWGCSSAPEGPPPFTPELVMVGVTGEEEERWGGISLCFLSIYIGHPGPIDRQPPGGAP